MNQDDRYDLLEQRLTALESRLESLSNLGDLSTLSQRLERLTVLETLVTRLEDNFSMIADIDTFVHLRDLLAEGNFKAADRETAKVLFGIINKSGETITPDDIENYPIAPLRIVDRLWRKYSNDHFGLSVQLNIYRELGGDINTLIAQDADLFLKFCDRVGWRQNGKILNAETWEPGLSSPAGALPATWWRTHYGLKSANFVLARLIKGGF